MQKAKTNIHGREWIDLEEEEYTMPGAIKSRKFRFKG